MIILIYYNKRTDKINMYVMQNALPQSDEHDNRPVAEDDIINIYNR